MRKRKKLKKRSNGSREIDEETIEGRGVET